MILLLNDTQSFEVTKKPSLGTSTISFNLNVSSENTIPEDISGDIVLQEQIVWPKSGPITDDAESSPTENEIQTFELYRSSVEDWLRYYTSGNTLYFTNVPIPPTPPEPTEEELEAQRLATLASTKESRIAQSKVDLSNFLVAHPLTWIDGHEYNVTQEKQTLLTSNLALYNIAAAAGQEYTLKWNDTGNVCTEWTIENLSALALAIGEYVSPLVTYQQTCEVNISNASTIEELNSIVCDYYAVYPELRPEYTASGETSTASESTVDTSTTGEVTE